MRFVKACSSAVIGIVLIGGLCLAAGGVAAAAAADNGTQFINYDYCTFDGYATQCFKGSSHFNAVSTPSGLIVNNYHNRGTSTYSSPSCSDASSSFEHNNYVLSQTDTKAYTVTSIVTSTFSCDGQPAPTCTTKFQFVVADGVVRLDRSPTTCT